MKKAAAPMSSDLTCGPGGSRHSSLLPPPMLSWSGPAEVSIGEADSLSHPPPVVAAGEAAEIAARLFGVTGNFRPLVSERDANFHIGLADGSQALLKISNECEPGPITEMQSLALIHLAGSDPGLPVQRICQTLQGQPWERITLASGTSHLCRLLTWVEGTMLHAATPAPGLYDGIGSLLARLSRALRGLFHPAAGHHLQWDIKQAGALRPMLASVADPALRARLSRHIDHFDAEIAPRLPQLRAQLVHNDLNPHNIVVDGPLARRPSGIIDFGDMVHTALACDLAIACSYHIGSGTDPLNQVAALVAGYHRILPLEGDEIDLLPALIRLRHVTTLTITSWRAARYPENAAYILRNAPRSLQGLAVIDETGPSRAALYLRDALMREPPGAACCASR